MARQSCSTALPLPRGASPTKCSFRHSFACSSSPRGASPARDLQISYPTWTCSGQKLQAEERSPAFPVAPRQKPETTMPGVHEPDCSPLHSHPGRAPSSPDSQAGETPPPALSNWLLPASLQAAVPLRQVPPALGPWDSPEGQSSPRRELCTPRTQGTEPPLWELLLAQRTGSVVGLVPALCSCSCRHPGSRLAPHPGLLATR